MTVLAKICGINSTEAAAAAVQGGAGLVGFVFYPRSPRHVTPAQAAAVAAALPRPVQRVGLFVDATDETIASALDGVPLDMLQLHGQEAPARVRAVRARFGLPVMKAIKVGTSADVESAPLFEEAADWLLFDAKPGAGDLPGGNARAFDWRLLAGRSWRRPWMLSGGLDAENVAEAVAISGAPAVDVSSGVESAPGVKDPAKIAAFLAAVRALQKPTSAQ